MCEQDRIDGWNGEGRHDWSVNRRQFAALGAAGMVAACTPPDAANGTAAGGTAAGDLSEARVTFATADGTMDGFFVHPASGRHPAILTWPDIAGVREAFEMMARRLAGQGFAVLVVNPYYRDQPAPQFKDFAGFAANQGFQKVTPWRSKLDAATIGRDATAAIGWLDGQAAVDTGKGVGTHGYCMGGPFTVWTAAAMPSRVKAAASWHGGGLVREGEATSPHAMLGQSRAAHIFGIAKDDDAKEPAAKDALRKAAEAAGRDATVEVYPAGHGWMVPDSPSYDKAQAERGWAAMSALFARL